jgi:HK97 family phage portal protein
MGVDDNDHRLGMSPLQRVIREVCSDEEAMRFTQALLTNMGAVGLVVTLPPNVPMTREEAEELRGRIDDKFAADGRGRTTVLTNGATMTQTGFNPQQLNLKDAHRIPEERIAAVLGVHPMVAGLGAGLDRSTFSNFEEARDALYEQTVVPLYEADAETWQKHLLRPDFDTNKAVSVRYDISDVRALQEDQNDIYARLSMAVEKKWITRNEGRTPCPSPRYRRRVRTTKRTVAPRRATSGGCAS